MRAGGARPSRRLLLRLAAGSGLVTLVCAATLLSPLLRVRTVVWTGTTIPEGVCRRVEATALGQPLFVLPERQLRRLAAADIDLVRRPPSTLEVRTAAPAALGVLSSGHVVRGDGRVAEGEAAPGLVQLEGIETRPGERVEPPVRGFLIALRRELGAGPLAPVRARAHGDEWELWLAGGSRVRLRAGDADAQLRKLRVFEQGLRHESLPARIDLRFAGQVVGAPEKRGAAEKRRGRRG